MILLKDIKGNKKKVDINKQQKLKSYQKLPGVFIAVKEILRSTREGGVIPWNKRKTQ